MSLHPNLPDISTWPAWRRQAHEAKQALREAEAAHDAARRARGLQALADAFEAGRKKGFSESEAQRHRKDLYGADA